jgi:putative Flp pilus-assembly TadE/G-like protein
MRVLKGRSPARGSQSGQVIPLLIVYVLVALTLLVVVVDVTAVHLQRNRLYGVADAAALDAAGVLDQQRFYGRTADPPRQADRAAVPISDRTVRAGVAAFLRRAGPESELSGLGIDRPTGTTDGFTAEVTLRCRARLPLFSFVTVRWREGVPVRATAHARTVGIN